MIHMTATESRLAYLEINALSLKASLPTVNRNQGNWKQTLLQFMKKMAINKIPPHQKKTKKKTKQYTF